MEQVSIVSLWLPILASSVLVFLVSWVLHAVLTHHKDDFLAVPDEDAFRDALGPLGIPPGQYVVPKPKTPKDFGSPEYKKRATEGPALHMTVVRPESLFNMGPGLAKWFGFCVVIGVVCAYLASRTLGADAEYLTVFRLVGTVAFACYAVGELPRSIWWSQKWSTTFKTMFDGLVYALVTAGVFGWLWPA